MNNLGRDSFKVLLVLVFALGVIPGVRGPAAITAMANPVMIASSTRGKMPEAARPRRVNIPYFSGPVNEAQSAVFWFGEVGMGEPIPGPNYVDVRIGYSPAGLNLHATVIDYYLWYKVGATKSDNLLAQDALGIYIDVGNDRSSTPQAGDYYFQVGAHQSWEDATPYVRQARGTGSGWDSGWNGAWYDFFAWQWSDAGPNNNDGNIDYGWAGAALIPWSTFGLSGPPAEGTVWGLGVLVNDQDQSSTSPTQMENWPETFSPNQPNTWGELHFGLDNYTPPPAVSSGSTVIRSASEQDNTVEDSWMGGGGWCNSGHEGHTEDNHGEDSSLFVGSENQPTHFPCFNKSYLRFTLGSLPAGKVILSATLTLHHWGGAWGPEAAESYVWLSSVTDPWNEMAIQWNNAPLAAENLSMMRIPVKTTPLVWPGDPYTWDVSKAVAEAYASGQPVSLAVYDSTTGRDSSKYLTGSEAGDWDIAGRPRLDIVWGDPLARVKKTVDRVTAARGSTVTYMIKLLGTGQSLALTDTLPGGLSNPISKNATSGEVNFNASTRQLTWNGTPASGEAVTIIYTVKVTGSGPQMLKNTAVLTPQGDPPSSSTALLCIDCSAQWLPMIRQ